MVMRKFQLTAQNADSSANHAVLSIRQGMIRGVREKLPNGKDYFCFRGIPYAKPPVGQLRFEPPVPLEKFGATVLDCSQERSNFIGMNILSREITGCEDALHLNVYSPRVPERKKQNHSQGLLPVMVFVHGGAMIGGSSTSLLYNPNHLVEQEIIVVSMNYRLGVLGFLCLPGAGIEGNIALKDQRLALRWVKENIEAFGGDPNNVTLFGQSSGGSCVGLHCMSESSRKYFHKAILQSGHHLCDFTYSDRMVEKARNLAKLFGYSGNSDGEVLEVLRRAPAAKLVELQFQVVTEREKELELIYQIPFAHVIERRDSHDPVVTKHPLEFFNTPGAYDFPIIIGFNDGETTFELKNIMQHWDVYNTRPEKYVPRSLNVDYFSPLAKQVGEEIKRFYLKDKPASAENSETVLRLISERYAYTGFAFSHLWSKLHYKANLYCYHFSFNGALNNGKVLAGLPFIKLAGHMDELFYIFSSAMVSDVPETDPAYRVRQTMVRLWSNFVKCSNPTPAEDTTLAFQWEPTKKIDNDALHAEALNIDKNCTMLHMTELKEIKFWARLYEKYNGHCSNLKYYIDNLNVT